MSVRPHGTTRLLLDEFSKSFGSFVKICSENIWLIKFGQKCKEFSSFYCIKINKAFYVGLLGGLVKSQIDLSSKGNSAEGSVGLHSGSIHHSIHYADKEDGLSCACLLQRDYIHISHKVCWQLAFMKMCLMLINQRTEMIPIYLLFKFFLVRLRLYHQNVKFSDIILCRSDWELVHSLELIAYVIRTYRTLKLSDDFEDFHHMT